MVAALFALSLVMIVGGIAAVIQGFPYVRLESGLAMVIGGTTAASAGVVLLGLAAVVIQLKRFEADLGGRRASAPDPRADASPRDAAFLAPGVETVSPVSTIPSPALAGAAGLAGVTLGITATADRPGSEPAFEREPVLPDLLPPEPSRPPGPDEDLFAHPEDRPGQVRAQTAEPAAEAGERAPTVPEERQQDLGLRPSLETPDPADEAAGTEPAPDAPKPQRQAVGSYASGGNTYVMYSDGTIDADTPRGRFTFQSLDELKEFVASGEAGERGAA